MKAILVVAVLLGLSLRWKVKAVVPSGPPLSVTAVPKSPRTVLVTWADVPVEQQNGALTEYEVLYEQSTFSEIPRSGSVRVGAGEEDEASLADLEEFVEYMISVRAYNEDGEGPYSVPVSVTTYQDAPSAAPQNFTLTATATSELNLNWERPPEIDINGILTFYSVRYHVVGTSAFQFEPVFDGDSQNFVLEGLDNYTTYEVLIAANTVNGSGPTTSSTGMTRENVPETPPQNVTANATSSSSILVTWEPPDQTDWNGVLRGYHLQYTPLDPSIPTSPWQLTALLTPNITSYFLQDLEPSTVYCIQITAVTVDLGPFSLPLYVATLESSGGSGEGSVMASYSSEYSAQSSGYGAIPTATPTDGTTFTGTRNAAIIIIAASVAGGVLAVIAIGVAGVVLVMAFLLQRHKARYKLRQRMSNLAATNPQLVFTDSNTREHAAVDNPQYGPIGGLCFVNPAVEAIQLHQNRAYGHGTSTVAGSDEGTAKVADNPQYRRFLPQGEQYLLSSRTLEGEYDYPTSFQRPTGATEDTPYSEIRTTEPPYATVH